jgi:hypothetical protein
MEEKKFSVKELAEIFEGIPVGLGHLCGLLLSAQLDYISYFLWSVSYGRINYEQFMSTDLFKALSNWNWDSHPPHTDDAILVLVEELLEKYRDAI